jgi:DNA-binding GntR family transcriptional regulator
VENFQPELPRRVELWENVLAALRTAILRGELPPGTRLVEAELSDKLGVSRGPVREALSRLEQEGLVEGLPRRGTVVVGLSDQDISEVYGMRIVLEGYAARLAAENATDDEVDVLQARVDEMKDLIERGQTQELGDRDIEFHRHIIQTTRNRRLMASWEPLAGTARTMLIITEGIYQDQSKAVAQHQKVVEAIRRRSPDEAEKIMQGHMADGEKTLLDIKHRAEAAEAANAPAMASPSGRGLRTYSRVNARREVTGKR